MVVLCPSPSIRTGSTLDLGFHFTQPNITMGSVCFFAMPSHLNFQFSSKVFGPIDTGSFRVTSRLPINTTYAPVYAAFHGYVVITDQIDSSGNVVDDYVNLILLPLVNNTAELQPGVFTFIYRGLKRDKFMTRSSPSAPWEILSQATVTSIGSEFMRKVYDDHTSTPPTLNDVVYIPYTTTDADRPLYNVLNDHPGRTLVNKGTELGGVDNTGDIGVDVVLADFSKYNLTLRDAAEADLIIDVSGMTGYSSSSQPGYEVAAILHKRESIHAFIDPAVYYSLHGRVGVDYRDAPSVKGTYYLTNDDLHTQIINKFWSRRRVYIDIRCNTDYSLNFYQDHQDSNYNGATYSSNLKVGLNGASPAPASYYTDNWPILIYHNVSPVSGKDYVKFDFEFYSHYSNEPLVYLDLAMRSDQLKKDSSGNYFSAINSNTYKFAQGATKFKKLDVNSSSQIASTSSFSIVTPATSGSTATAWLVKLYYLNRKAPDPLNLPSGVNLIPSRYVRFDSNVDNVLGVFGESFAGLMAFDDSSVQSNSVWNLQIGKRFIPGTGNWSSADRMVQLGVGLSNVDVTFFAIDIDRNMLSYNLDWKFEYGNSISQIAGKASRVNDFKAAWQKTYDWIAKRFTNNGVTLVSLSDAKQMTKGLPDEGNTFFSLNLTRLEFHYIQKLLNPFNTALPPTPSTHHVQFGIDLFSKEEYDDFYYGKGRLFVHGLDTSGNYSKIDALAYPDSPPGSVTDSSMFLYPGQNLFVYTADGVTYCTLRAANATGADLEIYERSPIHAVYSTEEYIEMVEHVEDKLGGTAAQIISRIRNHYYGFWDGSYTGTKFNLAIPSSPWHGLQEFDTNWGIPVKKVLIDQNIFNRLTAHADENGIQDNPSPYIVDPANNKIDVGHMLYGLDGLIYNYASTGGGFRNFQIYRSNDFTGYIADVFPAAAESRMYKNNEQANLKEAHWPTTNDIDRLYEIDAPLPDLYSDADAFGLYNAYKYFVIDGNPLPPGGSLTFSFLMAYYYDPYYDELDLINYPVDANYKRRWRNFCKKYDCTTTTNPARVPEYYITQYQGFIEETFPGSGTYYWAADPPSHISREVLRRRAETFATFWYQSRVAFAGAQAQFFKGLPNLLESGTSAKKVRFERDFSITASNETLNPASPYAIKLGNDTDPDEIDYLIDKFLAWVKAKFLAE